MISRIHSNEIVVLTIFIILPNTVKIINQPKKPFQNPHRRINKFTQVASKKTQASGRESHKHWPNLCNSHSILRFNSHESWGVEASPPPHGLLNVDPLWKMRDVLNRTWHLQSLSIFQPGNSLLYQGVFPSLCASKVEVLLVFFIHLLCSPTSQRS